jgi:hypothetical protein
VIRVKSLSRHLALLTLPLLTACALAPALRERMDDDFRFADRVHGRSATPLHRRIFGDSPIDGSLYRKFFESRVSKVVGENTIYGSCRGFTACHGGAHVVQLSDRYGDPAIPQVARLSLLVHEARHSDGFSHVTCPASVGPSHYLQLPLAGREACDVTALGGYGVQYVLLKNIERYCESCTSEDRIEAGRFADSLLQQILSPEERELLLRDAAAT